MFSFGDQQTLVVFVHSPHISYPRFTVAILAISSNWTWILVDNITPAIDRLFSYYLNYVESASEDTLFPLLASLHSLDDKLAAVHGHQFFDIPEYLVLKALRNHFHHAEEVQYVLKVKSFKGTCFYTDLAQVCLVSGKDCVAAIEGVNKKHQPGTLHAFESTTRIYGNVVDINPCIFNVLVKIHEKLKALGAFGVSPAFRKFDDQYQWESANGHPHYVTGNIFAHLADKDELTNAMELLYASA